MALFLNGIAVGDIQIHRKDFTCGRLATPTASQIGRYLYPLACASCRRLRFQFSSRCGLLTNYSISIAISISYWKDSGRKVVYVRSTPISMCDCEGKVRAIALRLRLRGNATPTASLKSGYVYDHQRHLRTTTSLQIGIVHQLLCYSVYSKCAVLHFVCYMRVIRSSHNATF